MAAVMPPGWCAFNSENSAKAGMNGNMSPSNGKCIIHDEMPSELTGHCAGPRIEYWKTIVTTRSFSIERTINIKSQDGTDAHTTFSIETDHHESIVVCHNKGQNFTDGPEEPDEGKKAFVNRTVNMQARSEADRDSPDDEFRAHINNGLGRKNVATFRLFTALCGFVRLAIKGVSWLQPDLSYAEAIFRHGDTMLQKEYGMPVPEPRRLAKRMQNLVTLCVLEAVAKVYFFKQTAVFFSAGKPIRLSNGQLVGKPFEIGHLWDVLRTMHPTREMILSAWSASLEYSIGTSSHGLHLMSALAEKVGFICGNPVSAFMAMPPRRDNLLEKDSGGNFVMPGDDSNWAIAMREAGHADRLLSTKKVHSDAIQQDETLGGCVKTIAERLRELDATRVLRQQFRQQQNREVMGDTPLQAITKALGTSEAKEYTNALFPTAMEASLYYDSQALYKWATGHSAACRIGHGTGSGNTRDGSITLGSSSEMLSNDDQVIKYLDLETDTGNNSRSSTAQMAKKYDFAWLVLPGTRPQSTVPLRWKEVAKIVEHAPSCQLFDMHLDGIADGLMTLASEENKRTLALMPRLAPVHAPTRAFVTSDNNTALYAVEDNTQHDAVAIRGVGTIAAHERVAGDPITRTQNGQRNDPIHRTFDMLIGRARLPALTPHVSTKTSVGPPLRRHQGGIVVSSVALFEHVALVVGASLACSTVPGMHNQHEHFVNGNRPADAFSAAPSRTPQGEENDKSFVTKLPYSYDIVHISWTKDLQRRFYNTKTEEALNAFNEKNSNKNASRGDWKQWLVLTDLPQMTIRYSAYASVTGGSYKALLSLNVANKRPSDVSYCEIATANGQNATLDATALLQEVSMNIGRPATDDDVNDYRRAQMGRSYLYDVDGDVYDFATFEEHMYASLSERGNIATAGDLALTLLMDCETMLCVRTIERDMVHNGESKMNLFPPQYYALGNAEKQAELQRKLQERATERSQSHANQRGEQSATPAKRTRTDYKDALRKKASLIDEVSKHMMDLADVSGGEESGGAGASLV
jgi:hypothetical protein